MDEETQVVYQNLQQVATAGSITNYTDVGHLIGLDMNLRDDRNRISEILDTISTLTHKKEGHLLSAVVVLREHNIPGEGFFTLARNLRTYCDTDDLVLWLKEVRRVHDYWTGKN